MTLRLFFIVVTLVIASCAEQANDAVNSETVTGDISALAETAWLNASRDRLAALTQRPGECLPELKGVDHRRAEIGRAAFRSPFLFGGPAARSGLSCNGCHSDGRVSQAFFIEGLSDIPGTADVSSAIFSKERGDGKFNPVPIPDLVDSGAKETFGTVTSVETIHEFVSGAVMAEFQGAPPPAPVLDGLAFYVASLTSEVCPTGPLLRVPGDEVQAAKRALQAAHLALANDQWPTADFLMISARHELGRIHERYFAPDHIALTQSLIALSKDVAAARAIAFEDPAVAQQTLTEVIDEMDHLAPVLAENITGSFYDETVVRRALNEEAL